jgi:homoserine dehydrogenase
MTSPLADPSHAAARGTLRVAILGAGTVGSAVVRGFLERGDRLAVAGGPRLELVAVATLDPDRARALGVPDDLLTDDAARLARSPDVDIVVELMGGLEPALTFVRAALGAGTPVVTANKALLAAHGPELETLARRTGAALRFEASVGGGIPVLGPLGGDLAANRVTEVRGIVNGTTNFILTAMAEEGRDYADVLADAQAAGYAEADPTADVEGLDAASKAVILGRLAFGGWLAPEAVLGRPPSLRGAGAPGIAGVGRLDVAGAAAHGLVLRLLAVVRRGADEPIAASVVPTAVPADSALGRTRGVINRIEVDGTPVGTVAFAGPGAGGDATSSAILGDLLAVARGAGSTWAGLPEAAPVRSDPAVAEAAWLGVERRWLTALPVEDRDVEDAAEADAAGLVIRAIEGGIAILSTGPRDLASFRRAATAVAGLPDDGADPAIYPVEDPR